MTDSIQIDVWSDIACPWCYIGKRNLEEGLAAASGDDDAPRVDVTFHSYELSPDTPADHDGDTVDFLASHKGIPRDQVGEMLARVTSVAAEAGLEYRFDLVRHANTHKAHELLHAAKEHGLQLAMAERLMAAYFTEGVHVGSIDDLVLLAEQVGLDPARTRADLVEERFHPAVRADKKQARAFGIEGVPYFVIDGKYGVSGAQPAEAFTQIVRQVWAEHRERDRSAEPVTATT